MSRAPQNLAEALAQPQRLEAVSRPPYDLIEGSRFEQDEPPPSDLELVRLELEAAEDEAFECQMERECDRAPGCPCRGCRHG